MKRPDSCNLRLPPRCSFLLWSIKPMNLAELCPLLSDHVKVGMQRCSLIFYASLFHPFFFFISLICTNSEARYFTPLNISEPDKFLLHNYPQLLHDFSMALASRGCWYDIFIPKQEKTTSLDSFWSTFRCVR